MLLQIAKLRIENISQTKKRKCEVITSVNTSRSSLIDCCMRTSTHDKNFPSLDVLVGELENILKACTTILSRDLALNDTSATLHIQSRKLSYDLINMIHMIFHIVDLTGGARIADAVLVSSERMHIHHPRLMPIDEHDDCVSVSPSEFIVIAEGICSSKVFLERKLFQPHDVSSFFFSRRKVDASCQRDYYKKNMESCRNPLQIYISRSG